MDSDDVAFSDSKISIQVHPHFHHWCNRRINLKQNTIPGAKGVLTLMRCEMRQSSIETKIFEGTSFKYQEDEDIRIQIYSQ